MRQTDKEILNVPPDEWTPEKLQAAAQRLKEIIERHRAAREAKASSEKAKLKKEDLL